MEEHRPTVLVVGATGRVAGLVVPELARRGATVRALVRDERGRQKAIDNGAAEAVVADLRDPASLRRAAEGADGVFHIGPAFQPDEARMGCNLVAAAQEAGVRKFVFSSVIQPTHGTLANHASKVPVETALFESELEYTLLHPANFFQNLRGAWPGIVRDGVFAEPYPVDTRIARVDYRDVAEVAAIALTEDRLAYGSFELCAPGRFNRREIVAMAGEVLGRPVAAREIDFDDWVELTRPPYDARQLQLLSKVHAHYATHGLGGNALVLEAILGRTPRTLAQYIGELAAS
ncbi:NmrA/HSCARG family protein [Variovorax sp. NFACC27]|uniref:NmrA/HSCARG family protein n=1 Tax=unclassified Variovorax TaxID=663243 RepID=UPI00089C3FA4|nr:NmrA/HSCARG family protein [Variovorax sp. YR750]SEF21030.1 Uncharacterized conserved protein YbjT, contains NAD(P)-binding and DUF2867 domains [Variovorax sp. NFACC28]SEF49863.1 Uncharacterized conserved protein YbjT, contains NAD(P)-binding and DUF2867 domains [Variovorax sp. NFACC29]SFB67817.1 Uncharacterized conserved protein YbjT, contains NAD(P)-binding and DUF2867 domains [Variovorax sp. NFACC26]SFG49151.1 Uncharacterized conserved protein YbjT, contains NAD(P)-binding and DUF2867 dom